MGYTSKVRRVRHAFLILIGRVPYSYSTEGWELQMAYEKTLAAIADLAAAKDRAVAKIDAEVANSTQATETVAQANADAAAADDQLSAQIGEITNALNTAAPAPVAEPAAE